MSSGNPNDLKNHVSLPPSRAATNDPNRMDFKKRVTKIVRQHHGAAVAYVEVPRQRRRVFRASWMAVLAVVLVAMVLTKSLAYATIGETAYNARVEALAAGSSLERAGAYVMRAGFVTVAVAGLFGA